MTTTRQQIFARLQEMETDLETLARLMGLTEKEVAEHLDHIARSAAARKLKLAATPSRCLDCGFVFKERRRHSRPGRCPKCKGMHLTAPAFRIGK